MVQPHGDNQRRAHEQHNLRSRGVHHCCTRTHRCFADRGWCVNLACNPFESSGHVLVDKTTSASTAGTEAEN